MVFLTFAIGVLNLCLGYALAVHLGYGPPGLLEAWQAISAKLPSAKRDTAAGEPIEDFVADLDSSPLDEVLDDEPDDDTNDEWDVESDEEFDDLEELLNPDNPEIWELNEKYVETSILKLNIAMMKSGAKATELDTRLRACRGHAELEAIRKCVEELTQDCETYLAEQAEHGEKFRRRIGELGELSTLGDEIEIANLEQAAQIETTLSNLEQMDFESDLEGSNTRLLAELGHLRMARHKLRDRQEVAFLTVARHENRMQKIDKCLYTDPLTDLHNRVGLEATLWQWWQQGRPQSHQISAALFDLDRFGEVNEEHGASVGDRILCQVAKLIREAVDPEGLVGRFAGQQFLVIMLDVDPRVATESAEGIRRSIEGMTSRQGEKEIQVTATGAIAEIAAEDTWETVCQRLEESLRQARRVGPNRSFFHNGQEAEPVESPDPEAKQREISV